MPKQDDYCEVWVEREYNTSYLVVFGGGVFGREPLNQGNKSRREDYLLATGNSPAQAWERATDALLKRFMD